MYLEALSCGYAVPRPAFDASVHSVFESAANLRLSKSGKLLTLVGPDAANLPQGIRLASPNGFSFAGLRLGESAVCRAGVLRIESISLALDFSKAHIWKCDLPSLRADFTDPAVKSAWTIVWKALNERQVRTKAEIIAATLIRPDAAAWSVLSRRFGQAVRALVIATRQYDLADISMLNALIGLGPGLTPAGDDFLVGYLAGLCCTVRAADVRRCFFTNLGKALIRLSRQTNDISRAYLCYAARGQVSSHLDALAAAICKTESPQQLLACAHSAMKVGHTSGMDTVTGLLFGLCVWDGSLEPQLLEFAEDKKKLWKAYQADVFAEVEHGANRKKLKTAAGKIKTED